MMNKVSLVHELKRYIVYTIILTLFFSAFTLYKKFVLEEYGINFVHYGYNLVQSLVLAKIILLGQMLNLGKRFTGRPLIVPTIYKTIVFSLFVVLFSIIEHFFMGYIEGKDVYLVYQTLIDKRLPDILVSILPMSFFFFFFFAFLEIEGILSDKTLIELFFSKEV